MEWNDEPYNKSESYKEQESKQPEFWPVDPYRMYVRFQVDLDRLQFGLLFEPHFWSRDLFCHLWGRMDHSKREEKYSLWARGAKAWREDISRETRTMLERSRRKNSPREISEAEMKTCFGDIDGFYELMGESFGKKYVRKMKQYFSRTFKR